MMRTGPCVETSDIGLDAATEACMRSVRDAAPRSLRSMGPLDGGFLLRLAAGMLFWELLFRFYAFVLSPRRRLRGGECALPADCFWTSDVPSYAVSTTHAVVQCWRALHHLRDLGAAPTAEQFVILPGGGAYAPNQAVELSNWRARPRFLHVAPQPHRATANARLFLAYLAYDLPHVYFAYPRLGGLDTVAHHGAFALASLSAGTSRAFSFAFGWLILCELSTPLLNARWFLKALQRRREKAGASGGGEDAQLTSFARALGCASLPALEARLDRALVTTFTSTRVVGYFAGVVHAGFASSRGYLRPIPALHRLAFMGLTLMGFALNVLWLSKLFAVAGKSRDKARATAAAAAEPHANGTANGARNGAAIAAPAPLADGHVNGVNGVNGSNGHSNGKKAR